MENNRIVFCTLAYFERCRLASIGLINSFLDYYSNHKLLIATDDTSFYDNYSHENIEIVGVNLNLTEDFARGNFPFNEKYVPIKHSLKLLNPEIIIYIDSDGIIDEGINLEEFMKLNEGVNVVTNTDTFDDISNAVVRERVKETMREGENVHIFQEPVLILRVTNTANALKFVKEWKLICSHIRKKGYLHSWECVEIGFACQRSGFNINDIRKSNLDKKFYHRKFPIKHGEDIHYSL